jgi:hypothetical protein
MECLFRPPIFWGVHPVPAGKANPYTAASYGAKQSSKMNFSQADMADTAKLNIILWRDERGSRPVPQQLLTPHLHHPDTDGD